MSNPIRRWWEGRALALPSPVVRALIAEGPTESGATISPETALTVPAVFACIQVLSQDLARTPIRLRQKTGPDTFIDAVDHPLFEILSVLSNPEQTAYMVKHFLQWQLLLYGRAFAEIVRVDGRVEALWPLESSAMKVDRDALRRKRWTYSGAGQQYVWTFDSSAPPILELVSETPITRCRELLGTALAMQQYLAKFFLNGARPAGILQTDGKVSDDTVIRLRDYWAANYGGSKNAHKVPVLDSGLKFEPISMSNDDAQMTETLRALNEQIAGAFRVPIWKIGDLSKANYSNMESGELAYVTGALDPLFELWEEALRRDLLTSRQFNLYTIQFDRQALVRNDIKSLNASLQSGIQNGFLSQNEARKAIGLNPIDGGDTYMVNTALAPISGREPNVA
jgi:HK97 family phage portal protein